MTMFSGVKIDAQGGSVVDPGKVGGLCGNFNGRDTDEFTKNTWPAGKIIHGPFLVTYLPLFGVKYILLSVDVIKDMPQCRIGI